MLLWWLLAEEAVDLLGLRALIGTIDATLVADGGTFPALLTLAALFDDAIDDSGELEDGPPMPIVDLAVDGNDIEAELGISLQEFLPLGGLRIQDNRVLARSEQAIVVNASPYGRNPRLLGSVLRALVVLVRTELPGLLDRIVGDSGDPQTLRPITKELLAVLEGAADVVTRMLETDYRISGNRARSQSVVIESNLYEVSICENHVTQEQSLGFEVTGEIVEKFREIEATKAIASAIESGTPVFAEAWAFEAMLAVSEIDFLEISRCLPPGTPQPDDGPWIHYIPPTIRPYKGPRARIPKLFGGPAIWAKSPGVNISENTALVPPDSQVESWSWGGILVKGDEPVPELFLLVKLAALLGVEISSILSMTETLVADNEVVGGYGHGVRIAETYLPLPSRRKRPVTGLISEVRVSGNQIRNMAGAGIFIDQNANAVGVDIAGNVIRGCSFEPRIIDRKVRSAFGGIVGRNCAFAKVHGNRVTGWGDDRRIRLFAIDFGRVFQLSILDNTVVQQGIQPRDLIGNAGNVFDLAQGASGLGRSTPTSAVPWGGIRTVLVSGALSIADNAVSTAISGSSDFRWVEGRE